MQAKFAFSAFLHNSETDFVDYPSNRFDAKGAAIPTPRPIPGVLQAEPVGRRRHPSRFGRRDAYPHLKGLYGRDRRPLRAAI
ncbi:hypothetical protein EMB92_08495 [Bifidobacterium callitrichos]|uniref:Uncharacterized protein n=1 Tax=Bifidobacterium callitrichos TaxID=762209 RepID=A0A5M9ZBR6_9BIFI|nr:hypothetical protein [Bifidobacterium callitrichos]KAA8815974.1 hypothetical protein EMB92_08495 [Bifidobacterium callitrichos]